MESEAIRCDFGRKAPWAGVNFFLPTLKEISRCWISSSFGLGRITCAVALGWMALGSVSAENSAAAADSSPKKHPRLEISTEGPPARAEFRKAVIYLLAEEEFATLEKMGAELVAREERWPEGLWKVERFYQALEQSFDGPKNMESIQRKLQMLDRWEAVVPGSPLVACLRAKAITDRAWQHRGSGWASTVTKEGFAGFRADLAEARNVLDAYRSSLGDGVPIPLYFTVMQTVALGQGWSDAEYLRLLDEAIAAYPDYLEIYQIAVYHWQPKWHGEEDTWLRMTEKWGKHEKHGPEIYTRVAWSVLGRGNRADLLESSGIKWDDMKEGFEAIRKRWPGSSWNTAAYCAFACGANDRETARMLFEELGNLYHPAAWGSQKDYRRARNWAFKETAK